MEKNRPSEYAETDLPAMKKKLFIAASYLAVSVLLLMLVTYGQYRIRIKGDVVMPAAETIQASLAISHDLDAETSADLSGYLAGLHPGDNATTHAGDASGNRMVSVTVYDHFEQEKTGIPLEYTLRIYSKGILPLQFLLVDGNDKYLSDMDDDGVYRFYPVNHTQSSDETQTEQTFAFAEGEGEHSFSIYVDWDNSAQTVAQMQQNTKGAYRKEVNLLELRVEVVGKSVGPGSSDTEEQLKAKVEGRYAPTQDAGE